MHSAMANMSMPIIWLGSELKFELRSFVSLPGFGWLYTIFAGVCHALLFARLFVEPECSGFLKPLGNPSIS